MNFIFSWQKQYFTHSLRSFVKYCFATRNFAPPCNILYVYDNQVNARALIGQSAVVYCAGKPTEKSKPVARGLQILLVFYQHPAWFISL